MTTRYNPQLSATLETVTVHEIHFHLGDILPQTTPEYSDNENSVLKVTMHYSDPFGRDRTKTITLPRVSIL